MRILIADDHPLYREALRARLERLLPEAEIVEVGSFGDVLARAAGSPPYSLFLVDFHMPGMSLSALGELARSFPDVPIAVVSGTAEVSDVRGSIAAGARGFIPKTANAQHLTLAVQILLAGGTSVPAGFLVDAGGPRVPVDAPPGFAALSVRELDVLKRVSRGLSNKEIGRELNLAEVTIKLHLRGVFRKIGARSRAEAAVLATKAGLS